MPDILSPSIRSQLMSKVKSRNTKIERQVRTTLHGLGYRFRLHRNDLPGNPDIVLPKYKTAIFVHGCFWHQHPNCNKARRPSTNIQFWNNKLDANIQRDKINIYELEARDWKVFVLWECELKNKKYLERKFSNILKSE